MLVAAAFLAVAGTMFISRTEPLERVEASAVREVGNPTDDNPAKARAAFADAAKVFFSARCINCHPGGDNPLQGDDNKPHEPLIPRGKEGRGSEDIQCAMCHLEKNTDGDKMPPGVPDWHMPPENQKMIFQGLTIAQLCNNLKDPLKNGGRKNVKDAVEHISTDPKVLWAWTPGNGRTTPPISHSDFVKKMNEWLVNGAACPK